MLFCQNCNNLLLPAVSTSTNDIRLICKCCFTKVNVAESFSEMKSDTFFSNQINLYRVYDDTYPKLSEKCGKKCPECESNEIKYAKNNLEQYIYICCNKTCGEKWCEK